MARTQRNQQTERPFYRKSDFALIFLLVAIAAILIYGKYVRRSTEDIRLQIYYDHELIYDKEVSHLNPGSFSLNEIPGFIFYADEQGGVKIQEAPCHDQICVHAGTLHYNGDMAICIPEKVIFKLVGSSDDASGDGVDMVIGQGKSEE